jgi:hypothetical protein
MAERADAGVKGVHWDDGYLAASERPGEGWGILNPARNRQHLSFLERRRQLQDTERKFGRCRKPVGADPDVKLSPARLMMPNEACVFGHVLLAADEVPVRRELRDGGEFLLDIIDLLIRGGFGRQTEARCAR